MALSSHAGLPELQASAQRQVVRIAEDAEVGAAWQWLREHEAEFARWQLEMARIPAPPFGEGARGEWLADRFRELGLEGVHRDDAGNVFGSDPGELENWVALSAHIDTVF